MKRRDLTADDLLRLQDNVGRKRPRLATQVTVRRRFDDDADFSTSDSEAPQEANELSQERQVEDEDVDLSSEDEDESAEEEEDNRPRLDSRFGSSRISIAPRSAATPTSVPQEPPAQPAATTFSSLGISPALLSALSSMSIRMPTEVQAACIPPLLQGERGPIRLLHSSH